MPTTSFPRDRFVDVPETVRVGAHRAENPRIRGWVVLLWAAFGPTPEGSEMSPIFYKWLDTPAPPTGT